MARPGFRANVMRHVNCRRELAACKDTSIFCQGGLQSADVLWPLQALGRSKQWFASRRQAAVRCGWELTRRQNRCVEFTGLLR